MILLRAILYVICFISLIWSTLFFVGPSGARWLISGISDGQIAARNITVTPRLDIKIGRLEYRFANETNNSILKGFSRSNKISWSLLNRQPLITVELGPTILGDLVEVNQVTITTKPFFEFDYQNIFIDTDLQKIDFKSFGSANQLNLKAIFKYRVSTFADISFEFKSAKADKLGSWSVSSATGMLNKIEMNNDINEQAFSADFFIKDLNVDQPKLTADNLSGRLTKLSDELDFDFDVERIGLQAYTHFQKVEVHGKFTDGNSLNNVIISFQDGSFGEGLSKISSISADISRIDDNTLDINLLGEIESLNFELSDMPVGVFPPSNFTADFNFNGANSQVSGDAYWDLSNEDVGSVSVTSKAWGHLEMPINYKDCYVNICHFKELKFDYKIDVDKEWIKGTTACFADDCQVAAMSHTFVTSNTGSLFTNVSKAKILNPLLVIYLYGMLAQGVAVEKGHYLVVN